MRALLALCVCATLAACKSKYDTDTGVVGSSDGADGADGTGGTGGTDDPFNTLLDNMVEDDDCAGYDGVEVTGATVYWYGEFDGNEDDGWVGIERSYHLANDAWEESGQGDCQITWRVTASQTGDAGQCASCDYGITLQASLDTQQTDCPADLWSTEQSYSVTYGVFEAGGGEVAFYFAESGNFWSDGLISSDGDLRYLRDSVCRWY